MRIEGREIGRVSVLVLDYDPYREDNPGKALTNCYHQLNRIMRHDHPSPTPGASDVTVLANEQVVAKHQKDFKEEGVIFLEGWQERDEYRELLREGLRQGEVYTIVDFGNRGGFGVYFTPEYTLKKVTESELEVIDRDRKIDIRPKAGNRLFPLKP